jgi:hypothetical protein
LWGLDNSVDNRLLNNNLQTNVKHERLEDGACASFDLNENKKRFGKCEVQGGKNESE